MVKLTAPPSATLPSATDSSAASSSVIVPSPSSAPSTLDTVALVAPLRVTVTVSFSSSTTSPFTGIRMLAVRVPAAMVTLLVAGSV